MYFNAHDQAKLDSEKNRRHSSFCFAKILLALLIASSTWSAIAITGVREAHAYTSINTVDDEGFAPEGYSWSFEFKDVESERGFEYVQDISKHYSGINQSDPASDFFDCVKSGDSGYAAYIGKNTLTHTYGQANFALRFTGGSYGDQAIDAIVSIVDWTYIEPSVGWAGYWMNKDEIRSFEDLQTGIFYNKGYSNDSRYRALNEQPSLSNINLYLVGLSSVSIEIEFVEAGTNTPVSVQGHATAIDIDCEQGIVFDAGVDSVEVAKRSLEDSPENVPFLSISPSTDQVASGSYAVSGSDADGFYNRALVGIYFTTTENTPLAITFKSPWAGENDGAEGFAATAMSFFALTPEYIANPSISDLGTAVKTTSAKTPVEIGEQFTFTVGITVPVEGYTCRIGYRYQSLEIADTLDEHLEIVEGSARFLIDGVEQSSIPGSVSYHDSPDGLRLVFDKDYLSNLSLTGQTLALSFEAFASSSPLQDSNGQFMIPNTASVTINDQEIETNTVYVEVAEEAIEKTVVVTKKIAAAEVYQGHGDPTFMIILSGTDANGTQRTYRRLASFSEHAEADADGYLSTSVTFENIPVGTYVLTEGDTIRYELESIESNGVIDADKVSFDLNALEEGWATITNKKTSSYGGSDATSVINWFEAV